MVSSPRQPIGEALIAVLDTVLYLDKKQIVDVGGVRLHPSETHLLCCAVDGMSFTAMAARFGISKGAVSQVFTRLAGKGVVVVDKDRTRNNTARVTLTPLGTALHAQVLAVRRDLAERLDRRLAGYTEAELAVVARFLDDLHDHASGALAAVPPPSPGGHQP